MEFGFFLSRGCSALWQVGIGLQQGPGKAPLLWRLAIHSHVHQAVSKRCVREIFGFCYTQLFYQEKDTCPNINLTVATDAARVTWPLPNSRQPGPHVQHAISQSYFSTCQIPRSPCRTCRPYRRGHHGYPGRPCPESAGRQTGHQTDPQPGPGLSCTLEQSQSAEACH